MTQYTILDKKVVRLGDAIGSIQLEYVENPSLDDILALTDGNDLTGLQLWPAAEALCGWLMNHRGAVCGKHVIELGAGATGLPGLAAMKLGASSAILSDQTESIVQILEKNIKNNFSENERAAEISAMKYSWTETIGKTFDVILGADVVYQESSVSSLVKAIQRLLKDSKSFALIAFSFRGAKLDEIFESELVIHNKHLQFEWENLKNDNDDNNPITLYRISLTN